jgi:hypothetical protein
MLLKTPGMIMFAFGLADIVSFIYLMLKVYRIFCYAKITFDQLPYYNPFIWPLAPVRILTLPYFDFLRNTLPSLKFGKFAYDVSGIVALELLTAVIFVVYELRLIIIAFAETLTEPILIDL